jgi:uncharacterized damage-inducible protein DinB
MSTLDHIALMAKYNAWMNAKLYETAGKLPPEALALDRKAFFKSILGTLNHIVVGDTLWLKRFAKHPGNHVALDPVRAMETPTALNQILFHDLQALGEQRRFLDNLIIEWAASLTENDLQHSLRYANSKGEQFQRRFASLVMHFFNHQTHHRGQATTLLMQAGLDVGVTDLLALIPIEA